MKKSILFKTKISLILTILVLSFFTINIQPARAGMAVVDMPLITKTAADNLKKISG